MIKNIDKHMDKELNAIEKDVIYWARKTHSESVKLAPSDTGNLRRTGFFDHKRTRAYIRARVGFTAEYAPHVHEILSPSSGIPRKSGSGRGSYWDVGQPKFLEIPARRNLAALKRNLRRR